MTQRGEFEEPIMFNAVCGDRVEVLFKIDETFITAGRFRFSPEAVFQLEPGRVRTIKFAEVLLTFSEDESVSREEARFSQEQKSAFGIVIKFWDLRGSDEGIEIEVRDPD